jgi:hypothetical protein
MLLLALLAQDNDVTMLDIDPEDVAIKTFTRDVYGHN